MAIISTLPYTIANGQAVDATPVMADLNQIVSNVNANAVASAFLAASGGAGLVGYSQGASGSVSRTVAAKLQESVSVLDFGADPTGVADSTAAFTNTGSGSRNGHVPQGAYDIAAAPTLSNGVFAIDAGVTLTGAGASSVPMTNSSGGRQLMHANALATDFATYAVRRNANYTGGTAGFVSSGFRVDSYVSSGAANYEWAITGVVHNSATGGQNVGVYGQGNQLTSTTGPTWGMVSEAIDQSGQSNPTNALIGIEVDCRANNTDTHNNRIGIHVVASRFSTAAGTSAQIGIGILIDNNNDGTNTTLGTGIFLGNTGGGACQFNYGIDLSSATFVAAAIKIPQGAPIAFDAAAGNQLLYDGTGLLYKAGGAPVFRAEGTGFSFGGSTLPIVVSGTVTSGAATATLTANKPGANNGVTTWLSLTISGTQLWIPAFGN